MICGMLAMMALATRLLGRPVIAVRGSTAPSMVKQISDVLQIVFRDEGITYRSRDEKASCFLEGY